jgi:hypothetical protein
MDPTLLQSLQRLLEPFVAEARPEGGIDAAKSPWQAPGRGSAAGSNMFPGQVDVRYLRFLVEALYRVAEVTGEERYRTVADAQARFMARSIRGDHPTWALGNALESIGLYHQFRPRDESLAAAARNLVEWARRRKVTVTTAEGVTYGHFPCGYGVFDAKDAGWTNDLSLFGSGLVWAYEVLGDESILADAVSFAEYFVQPWRPDALGPEGYWQCGSFREDLGSWVVGPSHYSGFESTDAYADEASWVFSTESCVDYLTRLYRHRPDPRFLDRGVRATRWTFEACQFDDGAIGMCGRDDKWLGLTGCAVTQVAMLAPLLRDRPEVLQPLQQGAARACAYLSRMLPEARIEDHGVEWVNRTTTTEPLVNVGMMWTFAILGVLNAQEATQDP